MRERDARSSTGDDYGGRLTAPVNFTSPILVKRSLARVSISQQRRRVTKVVTNDFIEENLLQCPIY
jgi:hypothetical protein